MGILRIGLLTVLTILLYTGKAWARWALIALVSLAILGLVVAVVTVLGSPLALLLYAVLICLHIWVVVELVNSEIAEPNIKNV